MRSLSAAQKNTILSQLTAGQSICSIASTTGISIATISRLHSKECSDLQRSAGGHPTKLSSANIRHCHNSPLLFCFVFSLPCPFLPPVHLLIPSWTYLSLPIVSSSFIPVPCLLHHLLTHSPPICPLPYSFYLPFWWTLRHLPLSPSIYTLPHSTGNASPHVYAYIGCNILRGWGKLILLCTRSTLVRSSAY